jgi:hypothetical protein
MGMKPPAEKDKAGRRSKRFESGSSDKTSPGKEEKINSFSKELARLQFFGAGPKMAGLPSEKSVKEKTRGMKLNFDYDPVFILFFRRLKIQCIFDQRSFRYPLFEFDNWLI